MKFVSLVLAALALLPSVSSAQNLLNGGMETWTGGQPTEWGLIWPTSGPGAFTLAQESTIKTCGSLSCRLVETSANIAYSTFGKQWHTQYAPIQVGDRLQARFRVALRSAPTTATVRVRAWGQLAVSPWNEIGTSEDVTLTPGQSWQDVCVGYTVTQIPAGQHLLVRVGVQIDGAGSGGTDVDLYVDNVSFLGSSPHFHSTGSVPLPDCSEPYTLRSHDLELQFDEQFGGLTRLRDMRNAGTPVTLSQASSSTTATLFEVFKSALPTPIRNTDYAQAVISARNVGTSLEWTYRSGVGNASTNGFEFQVTAHADPNQDDISIQLDVTHLSTSVALERLVCPRLVLDRAPVGANDEVFLCGGDGSITRGVGLNRWISDARAYPGHASMQWLAYYGASSGLAVAAHDPNVEAKTFGFTPAPGSPAVPTTVELRIEHRVPEVANTAVASYPIVLHAMDKSWKNGARWYKAWARQQAWANNLSATRQPSWIDLRPPFYEADWTPQGIGHLLVDHDRWKSFLGAWTSDLGTPMGMMTRLPERDGGFVGPYATPFRDETALAKTWDDLDATGNFSMYMHAALVWMISRQVVPGTAWWSEGFSGTVVDDTGTAVTPWTQSYCRPNGCDPIGIDVCAKDRTGATILRGGGSWFGNAAFMCPRVAFAHDYIVELAKHTSLLGLDHFEFDQMNGGLAQACYDPAHGHPLGAGRWMFDAVDAILSDALLAGQANNPDFCLSIEEPCEVYLPRFADYFGRSFNIAGWPASGINDPANWLVSGAPVSEAVPAFQFVYGDLLPCVQADLSLNEQTFADQSGWNWDEQAKLVELGRAIVDSSWIHFSIAPYMMVGRNACNGVCTAFCGNTIGCNQSCSTPWQFGTPWCYTVAPQALEPVPTAVIASHHTFLKNALQIVQGEGASLVRGEMALADDIGVPMLTFFHGLGVPPNGPGMVSRTMPAVQHSAWRRADGHLGILLLNSAKSTGFGSVTLPTRLDGVVIDPSRPTKIYRTSAASVLTTYGAIGTLTLQPLEAVLVRVD